MLGSLQDTDVRVPKTRAAFEAGVLNAVLQPRLAAASSGSPSMRSLVDERLDAVIKAAVARRRNGGGEDVIRYDAAVMLDRLSAQLVTDVPVAQPVLDDELDGVIPAELRDWLLQLRMLQAVPFAYLAPDSALLPEESIRWFYLDRRWTDALVQGALSVGTANSDDRTHLTAQYPAIRDELDAEERNQRRRAGTGPDGRAAGGR